MNQIEEHKSTNAQTKRFPEPEYVGGQDLYRPLVQSEQLVCSFLAWKRILKEVRDVNNDFHSLRTCIGVVNDTVGALHFLVYPSDGAMADKPLCGRILIPKGYPKMPPVVHMLTRTNRYNVDVFSSSAQFMEMHSSMCFDLLKPQEYGGTWQSQYTLSALMASLLQAIVSVKVPQQYGGEVVEYVDMERLSAIHKSVESTYNKYKSVSPSLKEIPHIEAMLVPTKHFKLPEKITSFTHQQPQIIKSNSVSLQVPSFKRKDNVYSIGFDLSDLKTNRSTVFSIILSNFPHDPSGIQSETILVRNGVTATAAKKKLGQPINWYYHGKPMNDSDLKIIVTIGYDQFCISYLDGDRKIIHGDCPVSFLTKAEIGDVESETFYLSVFLKNKGGPTVTVRTFVPEYGCIHPVARESIQVAEIAATKRITKPYDYNQEFPTLRSQVEQEQAQEESEVSHSKKASVKKMKAVYKGVLNPANFTL